MKTLLKFLFIGAALLILPHSPGRAEVYKYIDKKGNVHYTDNPDMLPEPQRSKVLKELEEQIKKEQERRLKEPGIEGPHERLPSRTHRVEKHPNTATKRLKQRKASRKTWKQRGEKAREKVAELEKKCAELKTERDRSNTDRLTFSKPGAGQRYQKAQAAFQKCQQDLEKARTYLEDGLPEQARKAGIPPGWIR